jgi:hypothetical protein
MVISSLKPLAVRMYLNSLVNVDSACANHLRYSVLARLCKLSFY